jgi:hypothetical protein
MKALSKGGFDRLEDGRRVIVSLLSVVLSRLPSSFDPFAIDQSQQNLASAIGLKGKQIRPPIVLSRRDIVE